ncbi:MAG: PilZ domain-containing protein [Planctomycetes bacterium]|nr:PilZ domain-containing protein [Planctomycetota bacterium]
MTEEHDRRRGQRVRVAAAATLATQGRLNANDQAFCAVRDVSRSGIGLETGQPPLIGQRVLLRLALDETVHELRTLATRVQRRARSDYYEVGLDWSGCTPEQLAFLEEVLAVVETQQTL